MKTPDLKALLSRLALLALFAPMFQLVGAAQVSFPSDPLATRTTGSAKPNLMFILDNSGSMGSNYLPDEANGTGTYGFWSAQCNGLAYDPTVVYSPPVDSAGVSAANGTFPAATATTSGTSLTINASAKSNVAVNNTNGISNGVTLVFSLTSDPTKWIAGTVSGWNSGTKTIGTFTVAATSTAGAGTSGTAWTVTVSPSYYYQYTSSQPAMSYAWNSTSVVTTSTFYQECHSNIGSTPGSSVFTMVPVVSTSTDAQNYANWNAYYSTRMLMMKTTLSQAFKSVDNRFRVGFTTISDKGATNSSTFLNIADFDASGTSSDTTNCAGLSQKACWYKKLMAASGNSSTPLRGALSKVGQIYAGKAGNYGSATYDPVQYSCQQNFTVLATDGYWNTGSETATYGPYDLSGNSVGNQDGTEPRPYFDGSSSTFTVTDKYSRTNYRINGNCTPSVTGRSVLQSRQETLTCTTTYTNGVAGAPSCGTWAAATGSAWTAVTPSQCLATAPSATTQVEMAGYPQTSATTASGGTSNSLADVAMYYYKGPLRSTALNNCTSALGANLCPALPNVPTTLADGNNQQHMNTFTISLGIDGVLNYDANYLNEVASSNPNDYYNIAHGSLNWPDPLTTSNSNTVIERIDDLWHAAVNGHGQYFSAKNPAQVVSSLNAALQGITARLGYGSGAATSNLVPVQGDNFLFTASYTTAFWTGNVRALTIAVSGTSAGSVSNSATWCSEDVAADPVAGIPACVGSMRSMVGATTDTRTIKYFNPGATNNVQDFNATNLTASGYLNWFNPNQLSQYNNGGMTPANTSASATNLINYLRGQSGNEANGGTTNTVQLYRPRTTVLGDIVDSQPVYVRKPIYSYLDPGYSAFVTSKSNRAATVFVGANDGMLHAIDASVDPTTFAATSTSGKERWAYIPTPVMQNMWWLADNNYSVNHHFYVDGSPVQFDVCVANCTNPATADWRTILVEGLDDGGRGYVALDVTDPTVPKALWEFTASNDADLGYAFGRPMSVKLQTNTAYGTQWVILVASGYDNGTNDNTGTPYAAAQQGSGHGFLYALDPITGAVISKIDTGAGSATAPSGLSQINAWSADPAHDATALYVYGGDLSGNVWRFDLNNGTAAVGKGTAMLMTTLHDDTGAAQPITTAPELANVGGQRVVYIGTGKYLEASDVTNTQQQSLYALKDDGTTFTLPPTRSTVVTGVAPMIKQTLVDTVLNGQTVRTVTMNSTPVDFATQRGWYADFPDVGERENIDMQLLLGTLVVPTNIPKTDVCTAGGSSWLNYLDYKTGGFVTTSNNTNQIVGQYYPADMTTGLSVVWINGTPTGIRTGTGSLPAQTSGYYNSSSPPGVIGHRVSWREVIQQQ